MDNNLKCIAELVDYIEVHLDGELDLDSLAQSAGYSKYHLHRMFTSIVGFSVHQYVQRRRLTEAARLLAFTKQPVMEIALATGYKTQQSFTKAFKECFHCSPQAFRKKRSYYPFQLKYAVDGRKELRGDMLLDFKIVESNKIFLVGYSASTAKGFSVIGKCWNKMNRIKNTIPNRVDMDTVIALDDYSSDLGCTESSQPAFNYCATVEVPAFVAAPKGMVVKELPASKYIVFSYKGFPEDSMQPVVEYIYREWFPQSTARLNEQAMYDFAKLSEILDSDGKGNVEFWVPIL